MSPLTGGTSVVCGVLLATALKGEYCDVLFCHSGASGFKGRHQLAMRESSRLHGSLLGWLNSRSVAN